MNNFEDQKKIYIFMVSLAICFAIIFGMFKGVKFNFSKVVDDIDAGYINEYNETFEVINYTFNKEDLSIDLPILDDDVINNKYFIGWFLKNGTLITYDNYLKYVNDDFILEPRYAYGIKSLSIANSNIKKILFNDNNIEPSTNYTKKICIADGNDSCSVQEYYLDDDTIYIQSSGYIIPVSHNITKEFSGLKYLEEIENFNVYRTNKVIDMSYLFEGDLNLKKLDVSHFDTSEVIDMKYMFSNLNSLELLDLSNFNTNKVNNMNNIFSRSKINYLDLSNWNISTNINNGFYYSDITYLDLSNVNLKEGKLDNEVMIFSGSNIDGLTISNNKIAPLFAGILNAYYNNVTSESVYLSNLANNEGSYFRELQYYNLVFNAMGGSISGEGNSSVRAGKNYGILPIPNKAGYTFDGWYREANYVNKVSASTKKLIGDETIYAKYVPNNYTITFKYLNDETNDTYLNIQYLSNIMNMPISIKKGYSFDGWYSEKVGGEKVSDGDIFNSINNMILYAHYTPLKYLVRYLDININSESYEYGSKYIVRNDITKMPLEEEIRVDFETFEGERINEQYVLKTTTYTFNSVTIYGHNYKAGEVIEILGETNLTVNFDESVTYTNIVLPCVSRIGYEFVGWREKFEGSEVLNGSYYSDRNVTLFATYKVNDDYNLDSGNYNTIAFNENVEIPHQKSDNIVNYFVILIGALFAFIVIKKKTK